MSFRIPGDRFSEPSSRPARWTALQPTANPAGAARPACAVARGSDETRSPARAGRPRREIGGCAGTLAASDGQARGAATAPSFVVAVIGDSEASRLADGLSEAFADDARVAIVDKTKDDSGLVRADFYDWRKEAKALLEGSEHFDLVVMQVGVNDNQKMREDPEHQFEPLSQPFDEAYGKRVDDIAAAFHDRHVPLVWVGLPIMPATRSPRRRSPSTTSPGSTPPPPARATSISGRRFPTSIPNTRPPAHINGAIVRLRGPDGVHFNLAGARKAAHFVEPEIKRVLEAELSRLPRRRSRRHPPTPFPPRRSSRRPRRKNRWPARSRRSTSRPFARRRARGSPRSPAVKPEAAPASPAAPMTFPGRGRMPRPNDQAASGVIT